MMGGHHVLLPFPVSPILPLRAFDHAAATDGVDDVVDRFQQALGHELIRQRRLHADQVGRLAGGQVRHQLHVDAAPTDGLDLEFETGGILLRPLVHAVDGNARIRARLAPYAHHTGLRLGAGRRRARRQGAGSRQSSGRGRRACEEGPPGKAASVSLFRHFDSPDFASVSRHVVRSRIFAVAIERVTVSRSSRRSLRCPAAPRKPPLTLPTRPLARSGQFPAGPAPALGCSTYVLRPRDVSIGLSLVSSTLTGTRAS